MRPGDAAHSEKLSKNRNLRASETSGSAARAYYYKIWSISYTALVPAVIPLQKKDYKGQRDDTDLSTPTKSSLHSYVYPHGVIHSWRPVAAMFEERLTSVCLNPCELLTLIEWANGACHQCRSGQLCVPIAKSGVQSSLTNTSRLNCTSLHFIWKCFSLVALPIKIKYTVLH